MEPPSRGSEPRRERSLERSRSRSPRGERRRPKPSGGFRWKEKRADNHSDSRDEDRSRGLDRGYRDRGRDDRRDDRRRRDPDLNDRAPRHREDDRYRDRDHFRNRDSAYRRGESNRYQDRNRDRDRDYYSDRRDTQDTHEASDMRRQGYEQGGSRTKASEGDRDDKMEDKFPERFRDNDTASGATRSSERKEKEKKKKNKLAVPQSQEAMIVVHVNDRLGTKAAIACLPSDPIKIFKMQVAAQIGREPHEILLKRQGERPFIDQLTLEDYGVSNGVQLDLEVDTGD